MLNTKKALKKYLKNHEGNQIQVVTYGKEYGEPIRKQTRVILESRSKDLITGRRNENGELVPVYLDYKSIDKVTPDFFELTTLLGNIVRFYFGGVK